MKRLLTATIAASVFAVSLPVPDAEAMRRGSNSAFEQRFKLKTEWEQARRAGGYGNPIAAFISLFTGEDTGNAVQPVINDPHSRGKGEFKVNTGTKVESFTYNP